jgi:hypothetical protein
MGRLASRFIGILGKCIKALTIKLRAFLKGVRVHSGVMQTKATTPLSAAHPQSREAESAEWLLDIGTGVSLDSLPPPATKRWVIRRKAEVVAAVRAGLLTLEEACARYTLSVEEFLSWQRLVDSHGLPGLRVTRLQDYRALDRSER